MAVKKAKPCAHCGRILTPEEEQNNGLLSDLRLKFQKKIAEPDKLLFHQTCFVTQYFCTDCWREIETFYREFAKK